MIQSYEGDPEHPKGWTPNAEGALLLVAGSFGFHPLGCSGNEAACRSTDTESLHHGVFHQAAVTGLLCYPAADQ